MGSFALVLCCALVLVTELPSDCSDIATVSRDLFRCPPERSRGAASYVVDPYGFVSCFYRFTSTRTENPARAPLPPRRFRWGGADGRVLLAAFRAT